VENHDRVLTFQKAKGANHLVDKDVYVIVTHLRPHHYARLNAAAQWLGIPDVIELYHRDQVGQAVGRNQGFRATANPRKAVVIISPKLAASGVLGSARPAASQPSEGHRAHRWTLSHDNEFSPRRPVSEYLRFEPTSKRPW
jgi:hypothetical protein